MSASRHISVGPVAAISLLIGTAMNHKSTNETEVVTVITLLVGAMVLSAWIPALGPLKELI